MTEGFVKQSMEIQHALCLQHAQLLTLSLRFVSAAFFFLGCGVNPVITSLASSFLPLGSVS